MFVWEMVSCRLRMSGWDVWHTVKHESSGPTYTVHLHRFDQNLQAAGPTLTDAYGAAARRVREASVPERAGTSPHLDWSRGATAART